jgi:hypothetical protein
MITCSKFHSSGSLVLASSHGAFGSITGNVMRDLYQTKMHDTTFNLSLSFHNSPDQGITVLSQLWSCISDHDHVSLQTKKISLKFNYQLRPRNFSTQASFGLSCCPTEEAVPFQCKTKEPKHKGNFIHYEGHTA